MLATDTLACTLRKVVCFFFIENTGTRQGEERLKFLSAEKFYISGAEMLK